MNEVFTNIMEQIEQHGLIVSKSKAARLLGTSRNTFTRDFVENKLIEPLPLNKNEKFSLFDVLSIPEKIKQRQRLNIDRSRKEKSSNSKTIDQIFEECYSSIK